MPFPIKGIKAPGTVAVSRPGKSVEGEPYVPESKALTDCRGQNYFLPLMK